jgi:hypothetical protein
MGLTVSCARCHDHKFDPFPTEDYYALAGIFRSSETLYGTGKGQGNRQPGKLAALEPTGAVAKPQPPTSKPPVAKQPAPGNARKIKQLNAKLAQVRKELAAARKKLTDVQKKNRKMMNRALRPFRIRIKAINKQLQQAKMAAATARTPLPSSPPAPWQWESETPLPPTARSTSVATSARWGNPYQEATCRLCGSPMPPRSTPSKAGGSNWPPG